MSRRATLSLPPHYFAVMGLLIATWPETRSRADFPIVGFDSYMVQRGNGREVYGAMGLFNRTDAATFPNNLPGGPMPGVLTNNGFDSFEIHAQIVSQFGSEYDLTAFGGVGGRFYEAQGVGTPSAPIDVGHDVYGTSFDPANYWLDVSYKLGADNVADRFDIALDQHDGFADSDPFGTQSQGEQFAFQFEDIINRYNTGSPDADGFVTLRRDITELPNPVTGDPLVPWDDRAQASLHTNDGDSLMDFDAFEGGVRNGVRRIQLKSVSVAGLENQEVLNVFIKSVKLVPKTSVPEVARLDGNTGFSSGFLDAADPNALNDVNRSGGNLVLDFAGSSGAQISQVVTDFDGTQFGVEVKAKVLPGSDSASFRVVAKDLDGNDDAASQGAEEWALSFDTSLFNETDFTTVFIPWTDATAPTQAFGFLNAGDGLLTDFNLYQFQVANNGTGTALKIEVESIKILPIPSAGFAGDYNDDGTVDAADYTVWRDNLGAPDESAINNNGNGGGVTIEDYDVWVANYGNVAPPGGAPVAISVPEPSAAGLAWLALVGCAALRTRRKRSTMHLSIRGA